MATVAEAAAAMLALFFTAVSVVASTSYLKVTTDIRLLVAHDDLNSRYLRLLAHTAAVTTAGAGLQALNTPPSFLLAVYVVIVAGVCFLAFLPLGIRTFALFDPSNLTGYPIKGFMRAVRMVTHEGRSWLDPSFQSHANLMAEHNLRQLGGLVAFAIAENRPRVLDIAKAVNRLGRLYAAHKYAIPSDSRWFMRRAEFKRWELASSPMTDMALRTGVSPYPESVPDHGFVEHQCTEMTIQCLRHLLGCDAVDDAVALLLEIEQTASNYARFLDQTEAVRLVEATRCVVLQHLLRKAKTTEPVKQIQLADVLCVAALAPILNPAVTLTTSPAVDILETCKPLLLLNRRGVYSRPNPRRVLQTAEDLFQRIEFENSVEGRIRTQAWYVRQVLASGYAQVIRDVICGIVTTLQAEFVNPASALAEAKCVAAAGVWLQRGIEACEKAKHHISSLQARYDELQKFHIIEAPWYHSGSEAALTETERSRVSIIQKLAALVPDLCGAPSSDRLPDLVGQTRAWIAEELVSMMERKEEKGFAELFVAYFEASMAVYRYWVDYSKETGKKSYLRIAMDTMLDLMDVSGLGYIFSELDATQFAKIAACAWDTWFGHSPDKVQAVRAWYTVIDSKLSLPTFSPSAMQRQSWGRRLAIAMSQRGLDVDRDLLPTLEGRRVKPHPSAIVESIIVHMGRPMEQPHEYFGALYLARRDEAQGIAPPREVKDCIDSIERARKRQESSRDETPETGQLED